MSELPRPSQRERTLVVGRISGVPIDIHISWLLSVAVLSTFTMATIVPLLVPNGTATIRLLVAVVTVLPISACIVAHEAGHAVVAQRFGLEARRITLFAFGGVSSIVGRVPSPRAETAIALAGPAVSVLLASILAWFARASEPNVRGLTGVAGAYALVNLALAIFNLVPAFPMDGGRLMRSVFWWSTKDRRRATRWAAWIGRGLASLLMLFGVYLVLSPLGTIGRPDLSGIWPILIGGFIFASAERAEEAEGDR